MSDNEPPVTPVSRPQRSQTYLQSNNFRIIYADGFSFRPRTIDFGVTFITQIVVPRELPDGNNDNVITNFHEIEVKMSLSTAKAFSINLSNLIAEIEKQTGKIRTATGSLLTEEQLNGVAATLRAGALND